MKIMIFGCDSSKGCNCGRHKEVLVALDKLLRDHGEVEILVCEQSPEQDTAIEWAKLAMMKGAKVSVDWSNRRETEVSSE